MSRPHPTGPVSLAGNPGHRDRHAGRGSCKSKASTQGRPPQGPPGQAGSHRGWGSPDGLSPDLAATCPADTTPSGQIRGSKCCSFSSGLWGSTSAPRTPAQPVEEEQVGFPEAHTHLRSPPGSRHASDHRPDRSPCSGAPATDVCLSFPLEMKRLPNA